MIYPFNPAPDDTAPSEQFIDPPVATDVPHDDPYRYLAEGLRDGDESLILYRLFERLAALRDRVAQKTWRLPLIVNPWKCPAALLDHLRAHVAFGEGGGLADLVARDLPERDLRKLIALAATFWKRRGRRDAMEGLCQGLVGVRPAIRTTWSGSMPLIGEMAIGHEDGPCDMVAMQSHTDDPASLDATGEMWVGVRVPPPPGGWTKAARWTPFHDAPGPAAPGLGDATPIDLVLDLLDLSRPMGARLDVAFVDWLDEFVDGLLPHWAYSGATPSVILGAKVTPGDPPNPPRMSVVAGSTVYPTRTFTDVVWSGTIRFAGAADTVWLWCMSTVTTGRAGYYIRIALPDQFEVVEVSPPVSTSLVSGTLPFPLSPGCWYGFQLRWGDDATGAGTQSAGVLIDNEVVIENPGGLPATHTAGTVAVQTLVGNAGPTLLGPTEVFARPLLTYQITGPASSAARNARRQFPGGKIS